MKLRVRVDLPAEWEWLVRLSARERTEIIRQALEHFGVERALRTLGIPIMGEAGKNVSRKDEGDDKTGNPAGPNGMEEDNETPEIDLNEFERW